MRVPKVLSAWFKFPDDPDNSEFKFKLLNPGELAEVQDASFDVTIEFTDEGTGKRLGRPTTKEGKEKEVYLATLDWKNVFDSDGSEIKYNKGNKLRPLRECPGFYEFFADSMEKLNDMRDAQEKNLSDTLTDSKKSQHVEPVKS